MTEKTPENDTELRKSSQSFRGRAVIYLRVSTMRQATKGGEAEGYSIPAQRSACRQRARDLQVDIVEEFVDAGQSARSADRPALHEMLARIKQGDIATLIVHKSDRLARSLEDHVAILSALKRKGVQLVSCMEVMDGTPSGVLTQGIMAAFNEFYSSNLSYEAKKGMKQKAQSGGTPGKAPIGYLNATSTEGGKDIRTVILDTERAGHISWAFTAYSTGEYSISQLADKLRERGLTSRATAKASGRPLSASQMHRLLTNKYYRGIVTYGGIDYEGRHRALVDAQVFQKVQELLNYRRINGDRSWRHKHHLKGIVFCGRCGSKMSFGPSKGKSGHIYEYFFCLGRHTGRTECDLPYLLADDLETHVERIWESVAYSPEFVAQVRKQAHILLDEQLSNSKSLEHEQSARLKELELKKQRLYDAYLEGAIPVVELKKLQVQLEIDTVNAQSVLGEAQSSSQETHDRLDMVLNLLANAPQLYRSARSTSKHALLQTTFQRINVNIDDDSSQDSGPSQALLAEVPATVGSALESLRPAINEAPGVATRRLRGLPIGTRPHGKSRPCATQEDRRRATVSGLNERTPATISHVRGSNVKHLAEDGGFEPPRA